MLSAPSKLEHLTSRSFRATRSSPIYPSSLHPQSSPHRETTTTSQPTTPIRNQPSNTALSAGARPLPRPPPSLCHTAFAKPTRAVMLCMGYSICFRPTQRMASWSSSRDGAVSAVRRFRQSGSPTPKPAPLAESAGSCKLPLLIEVRRRVSHGHKCKSDDIISRCDRLPQPGEVFRPVCDAQRARPPSQLCYMFM